MEGRMKRTAIETEVPAQRLASPSKHSHGRNPNLLIQDRTDETHYRRDAFVWQFCPPNKERRPCFA